MFNAFKNLSHEMLFLDAFVFKDFELATKSKLESRVYKFEYNNSELKNTITYTVKIWIIRFIIEINIVIEFLIYQR